MSKETNEMEIFKFSKIQDIVHYLLRMLRKITEINGMDAN